MKLDNVINEYVKTNGLLDNKTKGLSETVKNINNDLTDLELELSALEDCRIITFKRIKCVIMKVYLKNLVIETFRQR